MSLLVAPDPDWPRQAQREADLWRSTGVLGLVAIHHIGSTAIPGLPARGIIDLLAVFHDLQACDAARPELEQLGYDWYGTLDRTGRRCLGRNDPDTGLRLFQAHCFSAGSPDIRRHLAFRDALVHNSALRAAYTAQKAHCAARHPDGGCDYGICKSAWIDKVEQRALDDLK
ncbi:GrpB family protein [Rhodobacteraceae bacterium M382]|nr:GrpB family protein [Rhodobacteraceae bacterium M382]